MTPDWLVVSAGGGGGGVTISGGGSTVVGWTTMDAGTRIEEDDCMFGNCSWWCSGGAVRPTLSSEFDGAGPDDCAAIGAAEANNPVIVLSDSLGSRTSKGLIGRTVL